MTTHTSQLDRILSRMSDDAVTEKTASAPAPAAMSPGDAALAAVRAVSEKTASAQPSGGAAFDALQKIAAQTAAMEDEIMRKQAAQQGALFCDGFMQRLAQYDDATGSSEKTASHVELEKIAQAAYAQGQVDFEKQAAAEYQAGYDAQMAQVHKIASELHMAGQQSARNVVLALTKTAAEAARGVPFAR